MCIYIYRGVHFLQMAVGYTDKEIDRLFVVEILSLFRYMFLDEKDNKRRSANIYWIPRL